MPEIIKKDIELCDVMEIMAKIYKKHGSLLNAWRHFDLDGSNSVEHDEFMRHLPKVLGEPISKNKCDSLWYEFDPDMSGFIDGDEFCSRKAGDATKQGVALLKGQAYDPTMNHDNMGMSEKGAMVGEERYSTDGAAHQVAAPKPDAGGEAKGMRENPSMATMASTADAAKA
jgi:hypothetical protein